MNMMKQYRFKTDINCAGCVAQITPYLNDNPAIRQWKVDTANRNKILTIETGTLQKEEIKAILAKAGFKAESL
jgi:copper chaperone